MVATRIWKGEGEDRVSMARERHEQPRSAPRRDRGLDRLHASTGQCATASAGSKRRVGNKTRGRSRAPRL